MTEHRGMVGTAQSAIVMLHDRVCAPFRVAIRQTVLNIAYRVTFSEPKTAHGYRTISLDAPSLRALQTHRDRQRQEKLEAGDAYRDQDLVFARPDGEPTHPDFFSQTFDRTVQRLGLRRIRLHDLRHPYATMALSAGIDGKTVSARLGHATVGFTLDVYTKAVPQLDREAADKVARLIFGPDAEPFGSAAEGPSD